MNYFSPIGYISVLLWLLVPVLGLLYFRLRRRQGGLKRWLCLLALGVAATAYVLAKINSVTYVNRIQLDQSAEIAAAQARQEAAYKTAEKSRSGEVAQVRFAEDKAGDFMDAGGMDAADLKYMEKVRQSAQPDWKKEKKTRTAGGRTEDALEALGRDKEEGKALTPAPDAEEKPAVMMVAAKKAMADRLDNANLKLAKAILFLAALFVVFDYLRRANRYAEAFLPLPLPSAWVNAFSPLEPLAERPSPPRRRLSEELAWLSKRGDAFVYLTDDSRAADQVPSTLPRLGKQGWPMEVIHVKERDTSVSEDFLFEALWYGRCSFVVDSPQRIQALLGRFMVLLAERNACRAKAGQSVHIVWDCQTPPPEIWRTEGLRLLKATGFALLICKERERR